MSQKQYWGLNFAEEKNLAMDLFDFFLTFGPCGKQMSQVMC